MSWAFLFALHTAAELFLVGIECQTRLEQVKTRQCEIGVAVTGGGIETGRLPLAV